MTLIQTITEGILAGPNTTESLTLSGNVSSTMLVITSTASLPIQTANVTGVVVVGGDGALPGAAGVSVSETVSVSKFILFLSYNLS